MKRSLLGCVVALAATLCLAPTAPGAVILSDAFERTSGLAESPGDGGFSAWDSNDNGLGGTVVASYLTTNAANANQQTVSDGVGNLRFGRTILDYNLAGNAQIALAGGVRVQFEINPTDAGGGGVAGRDWGGVLFADTNSTVTIGGPAAAANTNANARFSVVPRNSGSLLYKRMNPNLVPLNVGNPFLGTFSEPVFDPAALAAYISDTEANRTANGFPNDTVYTVRIDLLSTFAAGAASTARTWIGPKNGPQVEMDFDNSIAGVTPAAFTWGANGGQAYLAFVGNAATHALDNLVVSAVPEPSSVVLATLTIVAFHAGAGRRRRG
ncbi:MAG TPA: hypothetical protein PKC18_17195 [Lacipirellulaceae bacterium]|nr:hypothetical protein [Lacipirellulaceae bacterium]